MTDSGPAAERSPHPWWGLVAISLGVSMIIVDATIVNVLLPVIIDDIGLTSTQAQWVNEVYALVFAALLLSWGRLADSRGRRRVFVSGVAVFAGASILAAVSGSGTALIGARVLQGVGGAMILPTTLALLNANFRGRERGIAFAVWGSTIGGTAALGPLLGGWLATSFSWRWAFGINVPLGLLVITGAQLWVRESRQDGPSRLDLTGAALSILGFATLVFGLIEGRTRGWWTTQAPFRIGGLTWPATLSPVPVAFAVALLALTGFVAWERHRAVTGAPALLDLSLFNIVSFRNGNVAVLIVGLGEFGLLFALPLWFQNVLGYTALQTGLALLPLAVGSFLASGLAGSSSGRLSARTLVRTGVAAEALGVLLVGVVASASTPWWATVGPLFVYGFGVGLASAQLTGVVLQDVPVEHSGQGSGTQSTSRQVGSALGIAVLGTLLFTGLSHNLQHGLGDHTSLPEARISAVTEAVKSSAGAAIPTLQHRPGSEQIADIARDSFSQATSWTAYAAAAFLGLGLLATARLGAGPTHDDSDTTIDGAPIGPDRDERLA